MKSLREPSVLLSDCDSCASSSTSTGGGADSLLMRTRLEKYKLKLKNHRNSPIKHTMIFSWMEPEFGALHPPNCSKCQWIINYTYYDRRTQTKFQWHQSPEFFCTHINKTKQKQKRDNHTSVVVCREDRGVLILPLDGLFRVEPLSFLMAMFPQGVSKE